LRGKDRVPQRNWGRGGAYIQKREVTEGALSTNDRSRQNAKGSMLDWKFSECARKDSKLGP